MTPPDKPSGVVKGTLDMMPSVSVRIATSVKAGLRAINRNASGINTAIFSLADGMLFRPLPFADPDRLVLVMGYNRERAQAFNRVLRVDFEHLRRHHSGFAGMAVVEARPVLRMMGAEGPERIVTAVGTPNLLALLGVRPEVGRILLPGDEQANPRRGVSPSDSLPRSR